VNPLQVEVQAVLRVSHPTVAATITVSAHARGGLSCMLWLAWLIALITHVR